MPMKFDWQVFPFWILRRGICDFRYFEFCEDISMEGGSERLFSWMYPMISSLWVWVCTRSVRSRARELRTRHESKLPAWAQPTITCHPSQPLFSVLFTFYRHAFWRRIIITDWETAPAQWPQIMHFQSNVLFRICCFLHCLEWQLKYYHCKIRVKLEFSRGVKRWYLTQQPFTLWHQNLSLSSNSHRSHLRAVWCVLRVTRAQL